MEKLKKVKNAAIVEVNDDLALIKQLENCLGRVLTAPDTIHNMPAEDVVIAVYTLNLASARCRGVVDYGLANEIAVEELRNFSEQTGIKITVNVGKFPPKGSTQH